MMTSPNPSGQQEIAIADYLDVLRRRKWVILQAFVLVACIGAVATVLSAPVYRATAKLQVEASSYYQVNMVNAENPLAALLAMAQPPSVETQMQVLQSRPFLREVLERVEAKGDSPAVTVKNIPDTTIIEVTAESGSPRLAAAVPNEMLAYHLQSTDRISGREVEKALVFVEREAKQAKEKLAATERKLIEFKQKHRVAGLTANQEKLLEEITALEATTRDTGNRIATLKGQREALLASIAQLPKEQVTESAASNARIDELKARLADLELSRTTALVQFKPAHPSVKQIDTQIAEMRKRIAAEPREKVSVTRTANPEVAAYRERLEQNGNELRGLEALYRRQTVQLGEKQTTFTNTGALAVQLAQLERERTAAEKSFLTFTERLQDLRIREKARRSAARIIEPAIEPTAPVRPRKATNMLLACMVGLCLGVSLAFLQEFLDDRLNSPEDVERIVSLPVLGHIPAFASNETHLITQLPGHSPITESYRALRTSITFSSAEEPIRTLLVSSAHQGEGKSHTSVNLAIAMALEGRRVILVDADLRRPNLHRLLDLPQSPGLSDVLVGQKTLVEALQPTEVPGLQVIASGPMPPNPSELLNSSPMDRLIEVLRGEADVVIFDTPPCIPVTDATLLSAKVDGVVLVVHMGEARKAAVKLASGYFNQARARVLGLVLNRIDAKSGGQHYYYYYRRGYYTDETAAGSNGKNGKLKALAGRANTTKRDDDA